MTRRLIVGGGFLIDSQEQITICHQLIVVVQQDVHDPRPMCEPLVVVRIQRLQRCGGRGHELDGDLILLWQFTLLRYWTSLDLWRAR